MIQEYLKQDITAYLKMVLPKDHAFLFLAVPTTLAGADKDTTYVTNANYPAEMAGILRTVAKHLEKPN